MGGRFFGKLHDADIDTGDGLQADGNLDGLFQEFAFSNSASPAPIGSTQDSEEKDVEYDEENKPLKRQRKRRRSAMDEYETMDVPLKDLKNTTKRKLNDGTTQVTQPRNGNIVGMTPRNRRSKEHSDLNSSILSDLMGGQSKSNKKKKRRRSLDDVNDEEMKEHAKSIRGNPFSVNLSEKSNNKKYDQSSQSESERQMNDLMKKASMNRQREHHESKEEDEEDVDVSISKPKKKKFKAPRFKNGLPPKIQSAKKKQKQGNIMSMWSQCK